MVWDAISPEPVSSSALYLDDAVQAVEQALTAEIPDWSIFHIQSPVHNARYLTTAARQALGYSPAHQN